MSSRHSRFGALIKINRSTDVHGNRTSRIITNPFKESY